MATDIETGEPLTLSDLHEVGYVVGIMLRKRCDVYDSIEEDLTDVEVAALNAGYDAGVRETEAELAERNKRLGEYLEANAEALRQGPAAVPVDWDEIPY